MHGDVYVYKCDVIMTLLVLVSNGTSNSACSGTSNSASSGANTLDYS